ncbi:MAG: hypothetical protein HN368_20995 [Spirochaetales bacterium]|nr:hypothetical protein [Spirochaetales bacterium]
MIHHRGDEDQRELFDLGFGKRPAEELYSVGQDPHHMKNLADDPDFHEVKKELETALMAVLTDQQDPRVCEEDCRYENSPYTDRTDLQDTPASASERWSRS